jgi:hypothetical protein
MRGLRYLKAFRAFFRENSQLIFVLFYLQYDSRFWFPAAEQLMSVCAVSQDIAGNTGSVQFLPDSASFHVSAYSEQQAGPRVLRLSYIKEGFFRSDLEFASGPEQHPLILVGVGTADELRKQKFQKFDLEEVEA